MFNYNFPLSFIQEQNRLYTMFFYIGCTYYSIVFLLHLPDKNKNIINAEYWYLSTGYQYFLKIAKINSQQQKTICLYHKNQFLQNTKNCQSAKIYSCKNFVPRGNLFATSRVLGHMICTQDKLITHLLQPHYTTATHNPLCKTTSLVALKEKIASNYYGVNRTENFAFFICEETRKE